MAYQEPAEQAPAGGALKPESTDRAAVLGSTLQPSSLDKPNIVIEEAVTSQLAGTQGRNVKVNVSGANKMIETTSYIPEVLAPNSSIGRNSQSNAARNSIDFSRHSKVELAEVKKSLNASQKVTERYEEECEERQSPLEASPPAKLKITIVSSLAGPRGAPSASTHAIDLY